jgi:hypothetical protein
MRIYRELSDSGMMIIVVALLAVMLTILYFVKDEMCNQKSISFEAHKFGIFSGCMVKHQGKWIPLENIRGFGDD